MALFPAYLDTNGSKPEEEEAKEDQSVGWLENSSFVPSSVKECVKIRQSTDSEEKNEAKQLRRKREKMKRKKRRKRRESDSESTGSSDCLFYEDKVGDKSLPGPSRSVNSGRSSPAVSKALVKKATIKKKKKRRKHNDGDRYFSKEVVTSVTSNDNLEANKELKMDPDEFFRKTEEFNKSLRDEPENDTLWLEYIRLQDKGEGTFRGIAEKKLSIVEKALAENPSSELLLNEKFAITEKIFPVDKLATDAKAVLNKDPKNKICWSWILKCNQFNLSRMTVPNVLNTYASVLNGIHSSHREQDSLLDILLQCGLFLRQAGLWEQLLLLLQLYLDLNLTDPGSNAFKFDSVDSDDKTMELEDAVITCGLPLGALWLRIEHLREGVHFLAVDTAEDPQRIVFTDDVSHLLFPVGRNEAPRLIGASLTLLKIPPLPMSDSFNEFIGLNKIPWAVESSEFILAVIHDCGLVDTNTEYIASARELLVPPQYINEKYGEHEFFNLVNSVFDKCGKYCESERVCLLVWQLRWWRFLVNLQGKDSKGFHSMGKKILKQYRDHIPLYVEYALLERQLGNFDTTVKVLETAILLRQSPLNVVKEKGDICSVYRTFVEVLLKNDFLGFRNKALCVLIALALGKSMNDVTVDEDEMGKAEERFSHLTTEILSDVDTACRITLSDVVLPQFSVSWLACHAWFVYLTKSVWQSSALVEKAIKALEDHLPQEENILGRCILENYYVILVNIVHHFCHNNPGHFSSLHEILGRACERFPNNLYFLNILTATGVSENVWQKPLSSYKASTLANVFRVFSARAKMLKEDSVNAGNNSSHQRMYSLLKKLTTDPVSENCPLIWRLFLQFIATENPEEIKKVFYQAAEKCPWVKSVYYGAAQILPEELSYIQDLLVEKELRLHITPEEIEILRQDGTELTNT